MRENQQKLPSDDGLGVGPERGLSLMDESLLVGGIRH